MHIKWFQTYTSNSNEILTCQYPKTRSMQTTKTNQNSFDSKNQFQIKFLNSFTYVNWTPSSIYFAFSLQPYTLKSTPSYRWIRFSVNFSQFDPKRCLFDPNSIPSANEEHHQSKLILTLRHSTYNTINHFDFTPTQFQLINITNFESKFTDRKSKNQFWLLIWLFDFNSQQTQKSWFLHRFSDKKTNFQPKLQLFFIIFLNVLHQFIEKNSQYSLHSLNQWYFSNHYE